MTKPQDMPGVRVADCQHDGESARLPGWKGRTRVASCEAPEPWSHGESDPGTGAVVHFVAHTIPVWAAIT